MRVLSTVFVCATLLLGCERDEKENVYKPGGEYSQRLDARGRRHVVRDGEGNIVTKVRVRDEELKVYSAKMQPLGAVRWDDDELVVERRSQKAIAFEDTGNGTELSERLRIERVEHGWAVFDFGGRRLGYFEWHDDGRIALRDDYSAAPRVFASTDDAEARTPAGQIELQVVPPYSAATFLPFLVNGSIDALDRVALGMWLVKNRPETDGALDAQKASDAGSD